MKINKDFVPSEKINVPEEKNLWTERRLQALQKNLFTIFKNCKKKCYKCFNKYCPTCVEEQKKRNGEKIKCHGKRLGGCDTFPCATCEFDCRFCKTRECDPLVKDMEQYLVPYGISMFKRYFKRRATCEEMDRVVSESVSALLMDIWGKRKIIHTSFGAMLKWKMIYFLDGNINLFDSDKVRSMDQMIDGFSTSNQDENAESIINFQSDTFQEGLLVDPSLNQIYKKQSIDVFIDLLKSIFDLFNVFETSRQKSATTIRVLFSFNRCLKGKPTYPILQKDGIARYWYMRAWDILKRYLWKYAEVKKEVT